MPFPRVRAMAVRLLDAPELVNRPPIVAKCARVRVSIGASMIDVLRSSCAALLVAFGLAACGSSSSDPANDAAGMPAFAGDSGNGISGASPAVGGTGAGGTVPTGGAGALNTAGLGGSSGAAGSSGASTGIGGAMTGSAGKAGSAGTGGVAGTAGSADYGGSAGYQPWPG